MLFPDLISLFLFYIICLYTLYVSYLMGAQLSIYHYCLPNCRNYVLWTETDSLFACSRQHHRHHHWCLQDGIVVLMWIYCAQWSSPDKRWCFFFFFFPVLSVCCSCLFATRHQQQDYKRKVMYKLYSVGPDVECIHLLWNPSKWKRSLWAPLKPYTCSNSQMHTQLFPSQREMAKNRKRKPLRVSVSSV